MSETSYRTPVRATIKAGPHNQGPDVFDWEPTWPEWHADARCVGEAGRLTSDDAEVRDQARRLCAQCPVRRECAAAALANDDQYHVWAGLDLTILNQQQRRDSLAAMVGGASVEMPQGVDPAVKERPECGTSRGYRAHLDADEEACELCKAAAAKVRREQRAKRKEKA